MEFIPIKTRKFLPPKDNIYELLDESVVDLRDEDILLITSKLLSIHQGRCFPVKSSNKARLIEKEAEKILPKELAPNRKTLLTIKDHMLVASAGIDESNAQDHFLLRPKQPDQAAKKIWNYLRKQFQISRLGIIITDSYSLPLRNGTLGVSLASHGLVPLKDYRGKADVFGRELKTTRMNVIDALAAPGAFLMGEGDEQVPLVIIRGTKRAKFTSQAVGYRLFPEFEQDWFYDLLKPFVDTKKDFR